MTTRAYQSLDVKGSLTVGSALTVTGGSWQVDSSGRVGIGVAPNSVVMEYVLGGAAHPGNATTLYGSFFDILFPATTTVAAVLYGTTVRTAAAAFTLAAATGFLASNPSVGATSTISDLHGFRAFNQGVAHVTNAYGLRIDAQSGADTLNVAARLSGGTTANLWLDNDTASIAGGLALGTARDAGLFRSGSAAIGVLGRIDTAASATGSAGLRLPHGVAPTTPTNGDIWTTTEGLFAQINGATVIQRATMLVGSDMTIFGHSYLTAGGVSYVDKQYITMLAGMLRAKAFDLAIGGAQAANDISWLGVGNGTGGFGWVLQNYSPTSAAAPYTPSNTLPFVHFGHNDVANHSHDPSGAPRTIFKTAMRTILSRLSAARIFENTDSSVAYGVLTWQAACPCQLRNSGLSYRPVPGSTATITITLPADYDGSPVAISFTVYPTSDGTITFSGTAGVTGTVNFANLAYAAGGGVQRRNSSNCHTYRITTLTSANAGQTIIMTVSGVSATTFSTPAIFGTLTTNGTAGSTTYGYRHAYRTYNGDTIYSTEKTIATGNATLTAANSITVPAGAAWPSGVEKELIIRTTGGTTQGIVGILDAPAAFTDIGYPATTYTVNSANPLVNGFAFDFWQIEASNPSIKGVVVGLNRIPDAGYINSSTDTDISNYNADLASVIAEFPAGQWLFVDADAMLNKTTAYFASDNIHPNNRGHTLLTKGIYNAIAAWGNTWTLDNIAAQSRSTKSITSRVWQKLYWSTAGQNTGSDMALTSTLTEVDVTLGRTRMAINAEVGDEIEVYVAGMLSAAAVAAQFDIATIDASAVPINYFSSGGPTTQTLGQGVPQLLGAANNVLTPISGAAVYKVQANDIITLATIPGQVRIMVMARAGSARTLFGGGAYTSPPLEVHLKNLSQRNFAFNGS